LHNGMTMSHPKPRRRSTRRANAIAGRREKVAQLLAMGRTVTEIAKLVKVDRRTATRDVAVVRAEAGAAVGQTTAMTVAAALIRSATVRERIAWDVLSTAREPRDRVAALRELRDIGKDCRDGLQSLGIVHKAPEQVVAAVRLVNAIDNLSADTLREIAMATGDEVLELFERAIGSTAARALLPGLEGVDGAERDYASPDTADDYDVVNRGECS
jgi:hypothetical protein